MTIDPERRSSLLASKLGALVRGRWGAVGDAAVQGAFPGAATLIDQASHVGWVLLADNPAGRVGAALAVGHRAEVTELHLIVDDPADAGIVARLVGEFRTNCSVWVVEGTTLVPAVASEPAPQRAPAPVAELYRPVLEQAGLVPIVEGGDLIGEYLGLEVARVVVDPDGSAHIEAGVGRFDRELGAMMFQHLNEVEALERAVAAVAAVRGPDKPNHPLMQLVTDRWLRACLLVQPELVGAASLRPVGSAVARQNLKDLGIATAVGATDAGDPIVVSTCTSVFLDAVTLAADDRLTHAPGAHLVLAVPASAATSILSWFASDLTVPAEIVVVPDDWQSQLTGAR